MSVYNLILTVVNGLAVAVFNFFYDNAAFDSATVASFFFLGFEVFAHGILIFVLWNLTVEKNIVTEQEMIRKRKKDLAGQMI
jgi:GPH family glycoside/pentoside/hexuronide:cation symporter